MFKKKADASWVIDIKGPDRGEKMKQKLPTKLRREFCDRTGGEMCLYVVYRALRYFYVAIWFYFSPFIAMSLQFIIPLREKIVPSREPN